MNGVAAVAFTPACANAQAEIERRIGELVAGAASVVCAGLGDWESGIAPATQTQAGDLFVELYRLQQTTLGEIDFAAVACREGKRVLWERHGAVLQKHYGPAALDALDEIVTWPLVVLAKVTAVERARMN
jgi:hypothetical protein